MIKTRLQYDLRRLVSTALELRFPIALWQMPQTQEKQLIVDFSGAPQHRKPDIADLPTGFLVAPFQDEGKAYFLHADLHVSSEAATPVESFRAQTYGTETYAQKETFWQTLKQRNRKQAEKVPFFEASGQDTAVKWPEYRAALERGIEEIRKGTFTKFVLSRTKPVPLTADFSPLETFWTLCKTYSNAFVSLVSAPQIGTWISATPEILISQNADGLFRTIALAGTQARGKLDDLKEASWRQKEIEEQALVSRYIIDCFKKIRLREFEEYGPRTVAAGNLIHLRTDFQVDTKAVNFPELPTVMLELLHPTSAVCGMPKSPALQFILENEQYDRAFYSGYLGPVHVRNETHLFVQLRCMQLKEGEAILYAGGGITIDSEPEKEWQETEIKFDTLGKMLPG